MHQKDKFLNENCFWNDENVTVKWNQTIVLFLCLYRKQKLWGKGLQRLTANLSKCQSIDNINGTYLTEQDSHCYKNMLVMLETQHF